MFNHRKKEVVNCPLCKDGWIKVQRPVRRGIVFVNILCNEFCPLCFAGGSVEVIDYDYERPNRTKRNIYSWGSALFQKFKRNWFHFFEDRYTG